MHLFQKTEFMNHYLIANARNAWTILNFDYFITVIRIRNASNSLYPAVKELTDIGDRWPAKALPEPNSINH